MFTTKQFENVVPWLMMNRQGLDVLVHPLTDKSYDDHSRYAVWLGAPLALRPNTMSRSYRAEQYPTPRQALSGLPGGNGSAAGLLGVLFRRRRQLIALHREADRFVPAAAANIDVDVVGTQVLQVRPSRSHRGPLPAFPDFGIGTGE